MNARRSRYVNFRVNEAERRALDIMAQREALPLSDMARILIREALEARGVKTLGLLELLISDKPAEKSREKIAA